MTDSKLRTTVTRAVALDRQIAVLTEELKGIKATLAAEASSRPELAASTDGGGTSTVLEGEDGTIARVTVSGPTLKSSVPGEGRLVEKVRVAAGPFFAQLFTPSISHTPVDMFRDAAASLMGRESAKLIRLVETPGRTSVAFETKEVT